MIDDLLIRSPRINVHRDKRKFVFFRFDREVVEGIINDCGVKYRLIPSYMSSLLEITCETDEGFDLAAVALKLQYSWINVVTSKG